MMKADAFTARIPMGVEIPMTRNTASRTWRVLSRQPISSAPGTSGEAGPAAPPGGVPEGETAPVLVVARLEEFAYTEATAIAVVILAISFVTLFAINLLERWSKRHHG